MCNSASSGIADAYISYNYQDAISLLPPTLILLKGMDKHGMKFTTIEELASVIPERRELVDCNKKMLTKYLIEHRYEIFDQTFLTKREVCKETGERYLDICSEDLDGFVEAGREGPCMIKFLQQWIQENDTLNPENAKLFSSLDQILQQSQYEEEKCVTFLTESDEGRQLFISSIYLYERDLTSLFLALGGNGLLRLLRMFVVQRKSFVTLTEMISEVDRVISSLSIPPPPPPPPP